MATGDSASKVNGATKAVPDNLDEAAEFVMEADPDEERAAQEFKETTARELKAKLDALGTNYTHNVEDRFRNLEDRYGEHKEITKHKQTDILRLNKITRDVSRSLGTDWKDVFTFIMAGSEKEVIEEQISKIEKERPFMQAYKALMTWRNLQADKGVDVDKLIEGLQVWDKATLADHVKAVLYSEGAELLQIGTVGAGIHGGAAANGDAAATAKPSVTKSSADMDLSGPLGDRKLLQLAKKIGPTWFELAAYLGLPDEDIAEVKGAEGATYQGAFKVMWIWRDRTLDEDVDHRQVLREALNACSMKDVAEIV